ncbi:MAG: maleylpyruvate isomerase N-terminal domain-containing protein [Nocardioides sp.]|jgi:uncharacterized protein (TIGR03083 family)
MESYLAEIRRQSQLFRTAILAADPLGLVPSCPDWRVLDLLGHLTQVQHFWATCLDVRPAQPSFDEETPPPADMESGLVAFDAAHERLMAAFDGVSQADSAWTWSSDPAHHTVGFIARRQALEALIHRVDAEQARGGALTIIEPALAADGVDEILDVMYGGCPPWGEFRPLPHYVRLDLTDASVSVWTQIGRFHGVDPDSELEIDEDDIHVVADPGVEPDAVVVGSAQDVLLRLWRREDGAATQVTGDLEILDRFRSATHGPIN